MFNYKLYLFLILKFLVIIFVNNTEIFDISDLEKIENYSYDPNSLGIKSEYPYTTIKSCLYTTKINLTEPDKNIFYIHDYCDLKLNQLSIIKQGETNDIEKSEKKGINSAILVSNFSSSIIFNTTMKTNGKGAHAIFTAGQTSYVKIYNSSIITYQNNSKGLVAKSTSLIQADEVEIITTNNASSVLYCDNSEMTCYNSTLTTIGNMSPIIFSIGKVTIEKIIGTALHSNMIILKNRNSVYVKDSKLYCNAEGMTESLIDFAGIFIYDSKIFNDVYSANIFAAYNSSFNVLPGNNDFYYNISMFSVANTNANITLLGHNNFSLGIKNFLNVTNNNTNTRNLKVFLFLKGENIKGNINCDEHGIINIYLTENSSLKGVLNNNSGVINLHIDSTSTLNLTNDSYINNLYSKGTINKKYFLRTVEEYEQFIYPDIILPNITSLNKINEDVECNKTSPQNSNKENNDDSSSEDNSNDLEKNLDINNNENNQNNGKILNFKFIFLLFIIHFI